MAQLVQLAEYRRQGRRVFFNRTDLNLLLAAIAARSAAASGGTTPSTTAATWRSSRYIAAARAALFSVHKVVLKGREGCELCAPVPEPPAQVQPTSCGDHRILDRQLTVIEN